MIFLVQTPRILALELGNDIAWFCLKSLNKPVIMFRPPVFKIFGLYTFELISQIAIFQMDYTRVCSHWPFARARQGKLSDTHPPHLSHWSLQQKEVRHVVKPIFLL